MRTMTLFCHSNNPSGVMAHEQVARAGSPTEKSARGAAGVKANTECNFLKVIFFIMVKHSVAICRPWLSCGRFHTTQCCTYRDAKFCTTKSNCECAMDATESYSTSLPLETYSTSLPLVSVRRYGHKLMKVEINLISSTDPFSLCTILGRGKSIELTSIEAKYRVSWRS